MTKEEALKAANTLGYPVLVRPSVIGVEHDNSYNDEDVPLHGPYTSQKITNPVLIDKYMMGTG